MQRESNPRLTMIKQKLQQHLIKSDLSLEQLFRYLDKDKSKGITIQELTRGLNSILTDEEVRILFIAVDKDQSNEITYEELITECAKIHCGYVLQKIKGAIESGKSMSIDKVFDTLDSNKNGDMEITEFNEMLHLLYDNVDKFEVDELFKHFDSKGFGKITKEDFKKALNQPLLLENKLHISLHDFMTPLQTLIKKFNLKP